MTLTSTRIDKGVPVLNTYQIWFGRALILGFLVSNFFAIPGIFRPEAVADLIGVQPPTQPIWLAFAFQLSFLVSWFYIPAAFDPIGNLPTSYLSVMARFVFAFFWIFIYPNKAETGIVPWVWMLELGFGIVQLFLLIMAVRKPSVPAE